MSIDFLPAQHFIAAHGLVKGKGAVLTLRFCCSSTFILMILHALCLCPLFLGLIFLALFKHTMGYTLCQSLSNIGLLERWHQLCPVSYLCQSSSLHSDILQPIGNVFFFFCPTTIIVCLLACTSFLEDLCACNFPITGCVALN